jgi:photosystem II stability/assembly factor-like uncharacterized protein
MKNIFILLVSFGFLLNTFSQWYQQSIPPDINFLLSIDFSNTLHGGSCGYVNDNGRAIYTNDSGFTWLNAQVPDSSRAFTSIKFINQFTGYIAGAYNLTSSSVAKKKTLFPPSVSAKRERLGMDHNETYKGLFLKTTNGGVSWFTYGILPDSVFYLIDIYFKDINTGFASADFSVTSGAAALIKTTNGGNTWIQVQTPDSIHSLWKILFINDTKGFAVGYKATSDTSFLSVLLTSADSGNTWSETNFPVLENLLDIAFYNTNTGIITGAGRTGFTEFGLLLKTTDGGSNWIENIPPAYDKIFSGVNVLSSTATGFVFGKKNPPMLFVSKTDNYGVNWTEHVIENISPELTEGETTDNTSWYICGGNFGGNAVLLKTATAGNPIGINQINTNIPNEFRLYQNYPNPFNPITKIMFDIGPPLNPLLRKPAFRLGGAGREGTGRSPAGVVLKIYDVLGKEAAVLVNERLLPGTYEAEWNATGFPSGIYFYQLKTDYYTETKKMVLVK